MQEAGEEGAGSRITKVAGSGRKRKKLSIQHCAIFCNRKNAKRWEPTNTGQELGLKGMGSVRCPPPLPHLRLYNENLA